MTILIDTRVGSKELIRYPPLDELGTLCKLEYGDICFTGNGPNSSLLVGVELKSMMDMISSISTGRLQAKQIPGMLDNYSVNWLLYYGLYRCGANSQLQILRGKSWKTLKLGGREIPYTYLESMLMTLTELGVHVKHVSSKEQSAKWIGALHRWWSKPWDKHKGLKSFDRSRHLSMPNIDADVLLIANVAKELPGLGYNKAVAAGVYFSSIKHMINASEKDWEKVEGVGKIIAESVVRVIKGR